MIISYARAGDLRKCKSFKYLQFLSFLRSMSVKNLLSPATSCNLTAGSRTSDEVNDRVKE